jgi:Xaa-Pro aminopeptidase
MPITVEPGIYLENRGGVRIEDTILIVEDGYRRLTESTRELREV